MAAAIGAALNSGAVMKNYLADGSEVCTACGCFAEDTTMIERSTLCVDCYEQAREDYLFEEV